MRILGTRAAKADLEWEKARWLQHFDFSMILSLQMGIDNDFKRVIDTLKRAVFTGIILFFELFEIS